MSKGKETDFQTQGIFTLPSAIYPVEKENAYNYIDSSLMLRNKKIYIAKQNRKIAYV